MRKRIVTMALKKRLIRKKKIFAISAQLLRTAKSSRPVKKLLPGSEQIYKANWSVKRNNRKPQ
jgi:hypothetical protein